MAEARATASYFRLLEHSSAIGVSTGARNMPGEGRLCEEKALVNYLKYTETK